MAQSQTHATDARPRDKGPTRFDWFLTGLGALMAALATTYYMTVTDPDHVYERDYVLVHRETETVTGEVVHVHETTNSLAVRLYRDGEPTNEILTTPAELADLHPAGRPLADDDEWDGGTEWEFDPDTLDRDDEEDN